MALKILDVSKYQPNIDYDAVAKEVDGVIIRVGLSYYGTFRQDLDSCFTKHYDGFKRAGVPVGAYFYSAAQNTAEAQQEADFTLKALSGKCFELPIYYDVENAQRTAKAGKEAISNMIITYCSALENCGYFVGLYSYTNFINNYINLDKTKNYTLWLADYRTNPNTTIKRDAWQYTSTATINGINGRVDLSDFYKDFKTIIINAGLNGFKKAEVSEVKQTDKSALYALLEALKNEIDKL